MDTDPADIGESRQISARVLLADDSQNERSALAQYLRRMGYEVSEASDGQATIEHLKSNEVDALLLDLNMPSVDGFDVLGYLQKHRRALPVVLLSGMPLDQIQQHISGLPSRELPPLMLKPIDVDQLLEVLELQMRGDLTRSLKQNEESHKSLDA